MKPLALAFSLLALGVTAALIVGVVALIQVSEQTNQAKLAARNACQRAIELGPPILHDYAVRHVLTSSQLERYRELIPKTCP